MQNYKNLLNAKLLKFHNYLMEGFRIGLKTFLHGLGYAQPLLSNCQKVNIKLFWGDNWGPKSPNLHDPYI